MFSDGKKKFLLAGGYRQRQDKSEKNLATTDGENIEEYDPSELPVCSEYTVNTCQTWGSLTVNEKRNKFLNLLKKNVDLSGILKTVKNNRNSEEENAKFHRSNDQIEDLDEQTIETHFASETSVSDIEDELKDESEEDWISGNESELTLESVCGLDTIKEALFNILIYPSMYPHFFPRKIHWNHILLFGPPGTGKTMIAKALASEINGVFLKITSADLLSHWQGQTEKRIKNLFRKIRSNSTPGILFFDEIDGLFRKRCGDENDHTRRIKTELLIHLDDFTADFENHQTFLIGATNCPWEIDSSFMRRFHKKIFVPLPDKKARIEILKKSFDGIEISLNSSEWNTIGEETEGYSGSDLVNIVMTSCCERFLEIKKTKHWENKGDLWFPVSASAPNSTEMNFEDIEPRQVVIRSIILSDVMEAITKTPRTIESEEMLKYYEFLEGSKAD